jgi:hypothetical protein
VLACQRSTGAIAQNHGAGALGSAGQSGWFTPSRSQVRTLQRPTLPHNELASRPSPKSAIFRVSLAPSVTFTGGKNDEAHAADGRNRLPYDALPSDEWHLVLQDIS